MPGQALRLIRDYAVLSSGEVLAKAAGFVAFAYLARTLGPEGYGAVELAVGLLAYFGLLVNFGFGPIGAREVAREPANAERLAARIPAARAMLAVAAAVLMAAVGLSMRQPPETERLILVYALALFGGIWMQTWLFQGLGRMGLAALPSLARMGTFAVGVVVWVGGPGDLWKVGVVEVVAAGVVTAYCLIAQRLSVGRIRLAGGGAPLRDLFREATPVGLSHLTWALGVYLPIALVATLVGSPELAWFGAAHRIVVSLGTFVFLYFFNLYPAIVRTSMPAGPSLAELSAHSFRLTAWLGVLGGLVGTIVAGPLCRLVYGETFAPAGATLAVLVWYLPSALLSGHARQSLIAYGFQRFELVAQVCGALACLLLGLLLVPELGAVGGAVAMVVSSVVLWAVAHRFAVRQIGPLPALRPLVRPLATAAVAWSIGEVAGGGSGWLAAVAAGGAYVAAAFAVEPALRSDVSSLLRREAPALDASWTRGSGT